MMVSELSTAGRKMSRMSYQSSANSHGMPIKLDRQRNLTLRAPRSSRGVEPLGRSSLRSKGSSNSSEDKVKMFKNCVRRMIEFLFTQVGVGAVVVCFTIVGASIFQVEFPLLFYPFPFSDHWVIYPLLWKPYFHIFLNFLPAATSVVVNPCKTFRIHLWIFGWMAKICICIHTNATATTWVVTFPECMCEILSHFPSPFFQYDPLCSIESLRTTLALFQRQYITLLRRQIIWILPVNPYE